MSNEPIAIITDSGTDSENAVDGFEHLHIVPLRINYSDGSSYESGVDISAAEVIERFAQEVPSTSLPSPARIQTALDTIRQQGIRKVFIITISSALSATYQTMEMVAQQNNDLDIALIDTKNIGIVAGLIVKRACDLIRNNVAFEQIKLQLQEAVAHSRIYFGVKNLEFLYKGGRISAAIYKLGSVLNIKPVLSCNEDGRYVLAKKTRGWDRALDAMVRLCAQTASKLDAVNVCLCATPMTQDLYDELEQKLRAAIPVRIDSFIRSDIKADLVVHTGPDLIGMGVVPAYNE